ncbi:hypothetical protein Pmani_027446 [Petrolisthes manimaculis]|uniref:Uncharacterized protein n=1 Tax=Petrolisthes manimaculis TaxID=1843537 RepID=A0AAE1TZ19_9EUCA|nr:hypothetical protein Pmani_027446 [Petrolisthes manimaculis]
MAAWSVVEEVVQPEGGVSNGYPVKSWEGKLWEPDRQPDPLCPGVMGQFTPTPTGQKAKGNGDEPRCNAYKLTPPGC